MPPDLPVPRHIEAGTRPGHRRANHDLRTSHRRPPPWQGRPGVQWRWNSDRQRLTPRSGANHHPPSDGHRARRDLPRRRGRPRSCRAPARPRPPRPCCWNRRPSSRSIRTRPPDSTGSRPNRPRGIAGTRANRPRSGRASPPMQRARAMRNSVGTPHRTWVTGPRRDRHRERRPAGCSRVAPPGRHPAQRRRRGGSSRGRQRTARPVRCDPADRRRPATRRPLGWPPPRSRWDRSRHSTPPPKRVTVPPVP